MKLIIIQLLALASLATEIIEIVSNQEQPFELCSKRDSSLTKIQLTDFGATKSIVYKNQKIAPDFINLFQYNEQSGKIVSKNVINRSNYNGTYECIEDRTWTQEVTVVAVVVLEQPSQPDCGFPLGNVLVEGNTVKFTCKSSKGYPEPDYFWFHNDSEIDHTRKDVVITVKGNFLKLIDSPDHYHYFLLKKFLYRKHINPNNPKSNYNPYGSMVLCSCQPRSTRKENPMPRSLLPQRLDVARNNSDNHNFTSRLFINDMSSSFCNVSHLL